MSTSLSTIQDELETRTQFQTTPITFDSDDYYGFVIDGAKRLYIDAGYETWTSNYDSTAKTISRTLTTPEYEYVLICSEIAFYNVVKKAWSTIQGYSTDALTLTYPNKPWENIKSAIDDLEKRLSELFYKITSGVGTVSTDES